MLLPAHRCKNKQSFGAGTRASLHSQTSREQLTLHFRRLPTTNSQLHRNEEINILVLAVCCFNFTHFKTEAGCDMLAGLLKRLVLQRTKTCTNPEVTFEEVTRW